MAARLSELSVLVTADTRGLVTGMEQAETRTRQFGQQTQGATRDVGLFARGSSDMTSQLARMSSGVRAAGSGMQGFGSALAGSAMAIGGPVGLIAGVAALGVSLGTTINKMTRAKEETEKATNALNLYTAALEKAGKVPQAPVPSVLPVTSTPQARALSQPIQEARLNEARAQQSAARELVDGLKTAIAGAGFSETSAQGRFFAAELAKAEEKLRNWTGMVEIARGGLDALAKATEEARTIARQPWEDIAPIWLQNAEEARDFRQATEDAAQALRDARASADELADAHAQNAADELRRNSARQQQEFEAMQAREATLREADMVVAQTKRMIAENAAIAAIQLEEDTRLHAIASLQQFGDMLAAQADAVNASLGRFSSAQLISLSQVQGVGGQSLLNQMIGQAQASVASLPAGLSTFSPFVSGVRSGALSPEQALAGIAAAGVNININVAGADLSDAATRARIADEIAQELGRALAQAAGT